MDELLPTYLFPVSGACSAVAPFEDSFGEDEVPEMFPVVAGLADFKFDPVGFDLHPHVELFDCHFHSSGKSELFYLRVVANGPEQRTVRRVPAPEPPEPIC